MCVRWIPSAINGCRLAFAVPFARPLYVRLRYASSFFNSSSFTSPRRCGCIVGVCDDSVSPSRSIILVFGGPFFFCLGKKIVGVFRVFYTFFRCICYRCLHRGRKGFSMTSPLTTTKRVDEPELDADTRKLIIGIRNQ